MDGVKSRRKTLWAPIADIVLLMWALLCWAKTCKRSTLSVEFIFVIYIDFSSTGHPVVL